MLQKDIHNLTFLLYKVNTKPTIDITSHYELSLLQTRSKSGENLRIGLKQVVRFWTAKENWAAKWFSLLEQS